MASRFSIFAMRGAVPPSERMSALRLLDVGRLPHERERDVVDAVLDAERQVAPVLLGERRRRQPRAGQVHALVRLQRPADHDRRLDLLAVHGHDAQLEVAVVEQDAVARLDVARQRVVGGRDAPGVALDGLVGGDDDAAARDQLDRPAARELARADLGPAQVLQDGDRPLLPLRDLAHRLQDRQVVGVLAVREVEPDDVGAGVDQALEDGGLARGGADGGNDLGAPHVGASMSPACDDGKSRELETAGDAREHLRAGIRRHARHVEAERARRERRAGREGVVRGRAQERGRLDRVRARVAQAAARPRGASRRAAAG